jgi:hypothetical protein
MDAENIYSYRMLRKEKNDCHSLTFLEGIQKNGRLTFVLDNSQIS